MHYSHIYMCVFQFLWTLSTGMQRRIVWKRPCHISKGGMDVTKDITHPGLSRSLQIAMAALLQTDRLVNAGPKSSDWPDHDEP